MARKKRMEPEMNDEQTDETATVENDEIIIDDDAPVSRREMKEAVSAFVTKEEYDINLEARIRRLEKKVFGANG